MIAGPVLEFMTGVAHKMEQFARVSARWTDRTGDARRGLVGEGRMEDGKPTAAVGHTESYGVQLEEKYQERYAILRPTVEHFVPEVQAGLEKVVKAVLGG